MPKIDWSNLPSFSPIEQEPAFKSVFVINPLRLVGGIADQRFCITDAGLTLVSRTAEEDVVKQFNDYLKSGWALPLRAQFVLNNFAEPRKEKWGFELDERVWLLASAISILTGHDCLTSSSFRFNDSKEPAVYYRPFISKEDSVRAAMDENTSVISEKEFETLALVYARLSELGVHKYDQFSKLLNAVRFYNRVGDTGWFLQKIVHAFVGLESLFTDSSKSEVTYKVSVRTAYYLHPVDAAARRYLFDLLKIAYDIRSSFIHGSKVDEEKFTKKLQKLKQKDDYSLWYHLPAELEGILSQVLLKILTNEADMSFFAGDPSPSQETEFYNKLVLGGR